MAAEQLVDRNLDFIVRKKVRILILFFVINRVHCEYASENTCGIYVHGAFCLASYYHLLVLDNIYYIITVSTLCSVKPYLN